MRVTVVHSFYSSAQPSGENVAVNLQVAALRRAGVETSLVSVSTDDLSSQRGYKLRTAAGVAVGAGIDPTAEIAATRPDVVHVHNLFPNYSTHWLDRWAGPLVATIHNYRPMCAAGTLARDGHDCRECVGVRPALPALRHRCYHGSLAATVPMVAMLARGVTGHPVLKRADQVIFLAPRAERIYWESGFDRPQAVTILPNYVDAQVGASVPVADRVSAPWVYAGRLAPEKGIVPALRNWPREVPLHVYGGGPDEVEVARLASESGGNVRYLGSRTHEELMALLPTFAGLVFPSMFAEGLPTIYLESLAAGLPVVARAGNSAADDVAAHGTGVVVPEVDGLADAVRTVSADLGTYSDASRARFEAAYSESAWVAGVGRVYERAEKVHRG